MKTQFKLAWFFFRMSLGVFLLGVATAIIPDTSIRPKLAEATKGAEWEAGIVRD